jgi:hypothetical protein
MPLLDRVAYGKVSGQSLGGNRLPIGLMTL